MTKIIHLGILLIVVASLVLIPHTTEAEEHIVQWIIPSPNQATSFYPNLVANIKFRVNDVLVFNFINGSHNVATLPKKKDFDNCNMSDTLGIIDKGPARIKLNRTGEYYFACQFPSHCSFGQKLSINVTGSSSSPSPAVAPSSPAPSMSVTSALSFLLMAISINVLF